MTILVTRPEPDNAATADTLRQRGFAVLLAPMLQFEALPIRPDEDAKYSGVIITSANALRATRLHLLPLIELPLYAVGDRTADVARNAGFANVHSADGDVASLRQLIVDIHPRPERKTPLLYLSGSDISGDLVAGLGNDGIAVNPLVVYRMIPVAELSDAARAGLAAQTIDAVLHYSPRSAAAYVAAIRGAALEIAGLAAPQVCLSEAVARVLREAGATRLVVAEKPQETALLEALARAVPALQKRRS